MVFHGMDGLVWSCLVCIVFYANIFPCKVSNALFWLFLVLYGLTQLCTIFVLVLRKSKKLPIFFLMRSLYIGGKKQMLGNWVTENPVFLTDGRSLVLYDYNFTEYLFQSKQHNLMGSFYQWDICILFFLNFVVPVFANMKQMINAQATWLKQWLLQ